MKEKERRTRKLPETMLYSRNLIKEANTWAALLVRYSRPYLTCTKVMKRVVILIVIVVLWTIPKDLLKEVLEIRGRAEGIQTMAVSRSASNDLDSWGDLLLRLQWKSAKDSVWNLQETIIMIMIIKITIIISTRKITCNLENFVIPEGHRVRIKKQKQTKRSINTWTF